MKACLKGITSVGQFVMLVLVMLLSLILCLFVGSGISYLLFDTFLFTLTQEDLLSNMDILKFFQSVYSIGLFILPPFILAYFFSGRIKEYLSLNFCSKYSLYFIVFFIVIFSLPLINVLSEINSNFSLPSFMSDIEQWMISMEENAKITTEKFLLMNNVSDLLLNIFVLALLPAVGEEFLFRGVVQNIFTKMTSNVHWGIFLAAVTFSAFHMQFFGFLPRLALGVLFGYLLLWSGSIYLAIFAHFLNNSMAVIVSYCIQNNIVTSETNTIIEGEATSMSVVLVAMLLFSSFIYLLYHRILKE